jgi:hypothetical protein
MPWGIYLVLAEYFGHEQWDSKLGEVIWNYWPKTYNGENLLFLHNVFMKPHKIISWYGARVGNIFFLDNRYKLVYAIWEERYDLIDEVVKDGFDINSPLDLKRGINSFALASELDKLEVLHYLELQGANADNLSRPSSKFKLTPLMLAVENWNVRMVEYLLKRKIDSRVKDDFDFTAKDKANIKNLHTIGNILGDYERKYDEGKAKKEYEEVLNEERQILEFEKVYLRDVNNKKYMKAKPSDSLKFGSHPFIDIASEGYIMSLFNLNI